MLTLDQSQTTQATKFMGVKDKLQIPEVKKFFLDNFQKPLFSFQEDQLLYEEDSRINTQNISYIIEKIIVHLSAKQAPKKFREEYRVYHRSVYPLHLDTLINTLNRFRFITGEKYSFLSVPSHYTYELSLDDVESRTLAREYVEKTFKILDHQYTSNIEIIDKYVFGRIKMNDKYLNALKKTIRYINIIKYSSFPNAGLNSSLDDFKGFLNYFGDLNRRELTALQKVIASIDKINFKSYKYFCAAPKFSSGDPEIGDGIGDLIIDDRLIDIKNTKEAKFSRDDFNQLIFYYLLYVNNKMTPDDHEVYSRKDSWYEINKLEIYYSRFAKFVTVDVESLGSKFELCQMYNELAKLIKRNKQF